MNFLIISLLALLIGSVFLWYNKKEDHRVGIEDDIKELAKQGHADTQFWLGYYHYTGEGAEQSYRKAIKWLTPSAEQGHAEAQYMLGYCYYYGDGVKVDRKKAIKWLSQAVIQNHMIAQLCWDFVTMKAMG